MNILSPVITALCVAPARSSLMANYANTVQGFDFVIDNELAGKYPGGRARATERRRLIAGSVRYFMHYSNGCGSLAAAVHIYLRTLRWNMADSQWRFVFRYFPGLAERRLRQRRR